MTPKQLIARAIVWTVLAIAGTALLFITFVLPFILQGGWAGPVMVGSGLVCAVIAWALDNY